MFGYQLENNCEAIKIIKIIGLLLVPKNIMTSLFLNDRRSYGYRGRDARNNLYVLPSGELLYYVGAVAIMYDKSRETQRHYTEHNEDIMW